MGRDLTQQEIKGQQRNLSRVKRHVNQKERLQVVEGVP